MPAPELRQNIQDVPLKVVGGNLFGRYAKVSVEQTFNMLVSDDALVPYAGYSRAVIESPLAEGRELYASSRGNLMIAVIGSQVFRIDAGLTPTVKGNLVTTIGDVFIAENNNAEIAITDLTHIYVYNWQTDTFQTSNTGTPGAGEFSIPSNLKNPGYISFQNGNLLVANTNSTNWYLSGANDATSWTSAANSVGALQTKPDTVQAAVPSPGGGNNMYLFGHNVIEQWQYTGAALFPYQRSSTFNVNYGTLNASSIAALDEYVVWISSNEQSGASLMVLNGNQASKISTDGIDYRLANLTNPSNCTGFLFRQDGHVIYQFTFPDDNLSFAYDFNTKLFFTVTDENLNYHVARNVVFFNNKYYFVSLKGGNIYVFGTQYSDIDYGDGRVYEIPRIRITPPLRLPSQAMYIIKSLGFTVESGQLNVDGTQSIDLSVSRDGGVSFGNFWRKIQNDTGKRPNRLRWQQVGMANDASFQIRFNGYQRYVALDGVAEVYS